MPGYLIDTNHLSAAIRRVSPVRDRIQQLNRSGVRLGTCIPVLCELEVGIPRAADQDNYRRRLQNVLNSLRLWPIEEDLSVIYGTIFHELRSQGRILAQVDMMLAALARVGKLTVLTADRDFEALPDIRTENWLADTNGAH
jgi:tRNA(fMet)-specific endonuclease VapC